MFDGIKTSFGEVKDMMKATISKLQDLVINLDVTDSVSEKVEHQTITIDTNRAEQIIAASTKISKI